jgi:LmbE family N-acetylglucosaminyl deacetylase
MICENFEEWVGKKNILVILAHPDDPEFFCGAMIAKWCVQGHNVMYCLVTKGQRGSEDAHLSVEVIEQTRIAEQRAAARLLGVSRVNFLNHMDGELVPDLKLREDIIRVIRMMKPNIIVTSDPQNLFPANNRINHPDHRAAGQAVIDAVFPAAGNPRVIVTDQDGEPVPPHQVEEVWLAYTHQPDLKVELSDYFEKKVSALQCHSSQIRETIDAFRERMMARWECDPKSGEQKYFEKFKRIQFQNK